MKKIYTVELWEAPIGVYSTLDKAKDALTKARNEVFPEEPDELSIIAYDLDSNDFENNGVFVDDEE